MSASGPSGPLVLNVQYQIDPAANSLLNVMCVLRPEVRYETRAAIG